MKAAARFHVVLVDRAGFENGAPPGPRRPAPTPGRVRQFDSRPGVALFGGAGKWNRSREVLLLFKTRASRLRRLELLILAEHPYDTPGIRSVPVDRRNETIPSPGWNGKRSRNPVNSHEKTQKTQNKKIFAFSAPFSGLIPFRLFNDGNRSHDRRSLLQIFSEGTRPNSKVLPTNFCTALLPIHAIPPGRR